MDQTNHSLLLSKLLPFHLINDVCVKLLFHFEFVQLFEKEKSLFGFFDDGVQTPCECDTETCVRKWK